MTRVGIVGMGLMGGTHLRVWRGRADVEVVAVCDINPDFGAVTGNIDTGSGLDLDAVAVYRDLAAMLAAERLDAVSVTVPTHQHKIVSVQCLEAGVHVLCEKPMARSLAECDAMIAAANRAGRELMIAQCVRFWPEYAWLKAAVEDGGYGAVRAADFSRLSAMPAWSGDSWYADESKSGGIALDLHIHDIDFVHYLLGVPRGVASDCARLANGTPAHVVTRLDYGAGVVVTATASWMMPRSFGFAMAFRVVLDKAAVVFDSSGLKVYPDEGDPFTPELGKESGYQGETAYFLKRINGAAEPPLITPEQARESTRLALETTR